jgi:hypothetical protein
MTPECKQINIFRMKSGVHIRRKRKNVGVDNSGRARAERKEGLDRAP